MAQLWGWVPVGPFARCAPSEKLLDLSEPPPTPPLKCDRPSLAGPPWDPTRHSRKGVHTVSPQTNASASSDPSPTLPPAAGVAGGLTNLSKMPACNIMLLGAQRKTLSGFSSTSVLPHTGYIYHSDIVQSLPPVSLSRSPSVTTDNSAQEPGG